MNYQHIFHAGNFADVLKHALLTRILLYLGQKEAPMRVIDTHAGTGIYNLIGTEAKRTNEAENGILKLRDCKLSAAQAEIFAPYFALLRQNEKKLLYPGSPEICRRILRPQDRYILFEAHAESFTRLRRRFYKDNRARFMPSDGWQGIKSQLPPVERRGVVLIDPPFEKPDEFQTMFDNVMEGYRRWPTGCFMLWYPIKDPRLVNQFTDALRFSGIRRILRAEVQIDAIEKSGLHSTGMIIINPPFTLEKEASMILDAMYKHLCDKAYGKTRLEWLVRE